MCTTRYLHYKKKKIKKITKTLPGTIPALCSIKAKSSSSLTSLQTKVLYEKLKLFNWSNSPALYGTWRFTYHVQKSTPHGLILCQINAAHTCIHFKIHINLYHPTRSHTLLQNVLVNGLACLMLVSVCLLGEQF
jgi:hypothetical protein